jgi:starvation-inducible outer membrane lipoprotein
VKKLILVPLLFLSACVSLPKHRADMTIANAQQEIRYQQLLVQANVMIGQLRERLVRFNQIDADGKLIPLKDEKAAPKK